MSKPAESIRRTPRRGTVGAGLLAAIVVLGLACAPDATARPASVAPSPATEAAPPLEGLWVARRYFGPVISGPLVVMRRGDRYEADVAGYRLPVRSKNGALAFDLPRDRGAFRGRLTRGGIEGHWIKPGSPVNLARYMSPVRLAPDGRDRWAGAVRPAQDSFTFYLLVGPRQDGGYGAILRNPDRDLGTQLGVDHLRVDGQAVSLIGQGPSGPAAVAEGRYDAAGEVITLDFPGRGGAYDFRREAAESAFYPRGRPGASYRYSAPLALDDGWAVGDLAGARLGQTAIERFMRRLIDTPMDSPAAPQVHAVLVARAGRLVVEEYFHGQTREQLHETRSASKSVTAMLAGAVIHDGAPLRLDTRVYDLMEGGAPQRPPDPIRRTMTLENLLTMSSGYYCDDSDGDAPGSEDRMAEQTGQPDWYRYTLSVPLESRPGEKAVYCSGVANLALGMVGRSVGGDPLAEFDRLVARPMRIERYSWSLDPAGNPFGGGSVQFLPRDLLKFGQLMLDQGRWDGRQVLSRQYAALATAPHYNLAGIQYGFLWWSEEVPFRDRTVRVILALGAGGQTIAVIPELDMVVVILAANYRSGAAREISHNYVPNYVFPAVLEPGDSADAVFPEGIYRTPYGRSANRGRVGAAGRER